MKEKSSTLFIALLVLTVSLAHYEIAFGQAFCALRDPTTRIYELYPQASSYRSLVQTVDEAARQHVADKLPFTIHFNELGRHTLYLPVDEQRPLGLVHARSETGAWGLTEIVWSLSPDLTVRNFAFQRCRSRKRTAVETAAFQEQLVGKNFRQLKQLLNADGNSLATGKLQIAEDAQELAVSVVRSALKTIAVTEFAWHRELKVIQPLHQIYTSFPKANQIQQINSPYNSQVLEALNAEFSNGGENKSTSAIQRSEVKLFRASGTSNDPDNVDQMSGYVAYVPWKMLQMEIDLWWHLSADGTVVDVRAQGGWPDQETKNAFATVKGLSVDKLEQCSSAAQIAGAEIILLVQHNSGKR